jgi:hypothetical protein
MRLDVSAWRHDRSRARDLHGYELSSSLCAPPGGSTVRPTGLPYRDLPQRHLHRLIAAEGLFLGSPR